MEIEWKSRTFDQLDIPRVLYKYRIWDNSQHQKILTRRELYLSRPSQFTDKHDCKIPIRYDLLTDKELFDRVIKFSYQFNPHFSHKEHVVNALSRVLRHPLRNPKLRRTIERRSLKLLDDCIGVLCLTAFPANLEMWKEYSANHTGFCVGLNGKELFRDTSRFGFTADVNYLDELPIIHPDRDTRDKGYLQVFSKLKKFEFEKEFRTTKMFYPPPKDDNWRTVIAPPELFEEIIFGAYMPEGHKQAIVKVVKGQFSNVKFRQAEIDTAVGTVQLKDLVS